jgi:hypothetical protein
VPELKQRLLQKLDEYNKRIKKYKKKYQAKKFGIVIDRDSNILDALYKREIVRPLLETGKADLKNIQETLTEEFNGYIEEDLFSNAISVISDYITTGGRHTYGGSGFFTDEMFRHLLKQSTVLDYPRPADQRVFLQKKYYEYVGRNVVYEQRVETTADHAAMKRNRYKIRILSDLQEQKRVYVEELAEDLQIKEGRGFDKMEFYNALRQVQALLKWSKD